MSRFPVKTEYLCAGIAILLWSTIAAAAKLLQSSLDSMQILAGASLLAFVFLFFVCLFTGRLRELRRLRAKDWPILFGVGLLGTFVYNLFLYLGIERMQASQAFIINYLWPVLIVLFACLILKEPLTARKLLAIGLSFLGVVIVTAGGDLLHIEPQTLSGALFCVGAAVSYGLFSVLNKRLHYEKYTSMMLFYAFSAVLSFGWLAVRGGWFAPDLPQLAGLVWTGVGTYAIPYTAWALALDRGDTAKISNLAYITPLLSLVWTALLLHEPLSPYSVLGLVFILAGVLIQLRDRTKKEGKTDETTAEKQI